jgi:hypothetical protein
VVYDGLIKRETSYTLIHRTDIDITTGKTSKVFQVSYDYIYEQVQTLTTSSDPTNPNEQAVYSAEYGKLTHRQILNICKNPFRGSNKGQDGIIKHDKIHVRSMTFDKEIVNRVGEGLKAITDIKILDEDEDEEPSNGVTEF